MSLLQKIKADQLQARKDKASVKASVLTTLIGEASVIGKNDGGRDTTDQEVQAVIKKFVKNIEETLKAPSLSINAYTVLTHEQEILTAYLPSQMTVDQLTDTITAIAAEVGATSAKDLGKVMKEMQTRHAGTYDGSAASTIAKLVLK